MSLYQFQDASGVLLDAHFEVRNGKLFLLSRGGTKGAANARNTQYGPALRILLERINQSALSLAGAWVDSSRVQHLTMGERRILSPEETDVPPTKLFTLLSRRMAKVGRDPRSLSLGNSNKKLRFIFTGGVSDEQIIRIVGLGDFGDNSNGRGRLLAATLKKVSEDHIWRAIQQLRSGSVKHVFGEFTEYDVVDQDVGKRWPPKAIFGLAATEALGFEVKPEHFENGVRTICHKSIIHAGFRIVKKNQTIQSKQLPLSSEEREWVEGQPKMKQHLQRERGAGISLEKKVQFKREHGRLYCEDCGLDPVKTYGVQFGEACIEVHHVVPLAKLPPGYRTKLSDLKCLCANCHRIEHRRLGKAEL